MNTDGFWSRIVRNDDNACWPWTGARSSNGQGISRWNGRQQRPAHRVAFFLVKGYWPRGVVLHTCKTRDCCNPQHMIEGAAARLWSRIKRGEPSACWPWQGARNAAGYGHVSWHGRTVSSHRIVFFLAHGHWPNVARHSCDEPSCCNPEHIVDGTHQDNVADCVTRGRRPHGEAHREKCRRFAARGNRHGSRTHPESRPRGDKHPYTKVTDADVIFIRNSTQTDAELAAIFGIRKDSVNRIRHGRRRPMQYTSGSRRD